MSMCGGLMSKLNPEEILRGIITWENDLADFRFYSCPNSMRLPDWLNLFRQPHIIFPQMTRGQIITPIVAKRKFVRVIIKKLRRKKLTIKLVA